MNSNSELMYRILLDQALSAGLCLTDLELSPLLPDILLKAPLQPAIGTEKSLFLKASIG